MHYNYIDRLLVVNVFVEESDQLFFLLISIFHKPGNTEGDQLVMTILLRLTTRKEKQSKPCSCSFSKELHDAPFHHEPKHTRKVEQNSQKYEIQRNPLIIRVIHDSVGVIILIPPRAGSLVLPGDVPGGVHPAVGLQHIQLYSPTSLEGNIIDDLIHGIAEKWW